MNDSNKRPSGVVGLLWRLVRYIFAKLNKVFDGIIYSNVGSALICLIAAISICIAINYDTFYSKILQDSTITQEINNVSVNVLYDDDKYEISGVPSSVTVTLSGGAADIQVFRHQRDIKVQADLRKYSAGNNIVDLKVENLPSNVKATIDPETISVDLEKKSKKTFTVTSEILTSSNQKASDYSVTLSSNTVSVTGTQEEIDSIRTVKALIDTSEKKDSFSTDAVLVAYDSKGATVSVRFSPMTIRANVQNKASDSDNEE